LTAKHIHAPMTKRHHHRLGYTITRLAPQSAGLVKPGLKSSAHRKKGTRRPLLPVAHNRTAVIHRKSAN
jgi:hypothetical protein